MKNEIEIRRVAFNFGVFFPQWRKNEHEDWRFFPSRWPSTTPCCMSYPDRASANRHAGLPEELPAVNLQTEEDKAFYAAYSRLRKRLKK